MAVQGKAVNLVIAPSQLLAAECIPSGQQKAGFELLFSSQSFEFL